MNFTFWLGEEAETVAVYLETHEQLARELIDFLPVHADLTDPQADE